MPTKTTLQPWPKPSAPWQRLYVDYAGPINNEYFLVLVDAFSKWPEIIPTKSITTQQTIGILNEIFSRLGLPSTVVTDNGTQFTSVDFQKYLSKNGIKHMRSSPYYPMSNGQAERFVDTFKRALKKMKGEGTTSQNLQVFLQCYRASPNKNNENNKSPAEVLLGRNIRTNLDLLRPKLLSDTQGVLEPQQLRTKQYYDRKHGAKPKSYSNQDLVWARVFNNKNGYQWMPGKVIERFGKVMYNVLLENFKLIRVHANQLRNRFARNAEPSMIKEMKNTQTLIDAFGLYESEHNLTARLKNGPLGETSQQLDGGLSNVDNDRVTSEAATRPQRVRRPVERFVPGSPRVKKDKNKRKPT